MKEQVDAQRIVSMGAEATKVRIGGNMKYDIDIRSVGLQTLEALDKALGVTTGPGPLIVAGSTHESEEDILLKVLSEVIKRPGLANTRMMIAPRHIERANAVEYIARQAGFTVSRRSKLNPTHDARVLVLDTHGELAAAYHFADLAFVGGTLSDTAGGHSILEPAAYGKPIVIGPHMENFGSISDDFTTAGAAIAIHSDINDAASASEELCTAFTSILSDAKLSVAMGDAARHMIDANKGAAKNAADTIDSLLDASLPHMSESDPLL
jgi:3-deoxy-D-manno-octulosonic-acid transferase